MRRTLIATALVLATAAVQAPGGQPKVADLAGELAELKQQLADLRQGGKGGPKTGFVNIVRVFDELEEKEDMNVDLRKMETRRETELRELANRIKNLTEANKLLRPDSAEHKKNSQELEEAKTDFRSRRDASEDRLYGKLFDFTHRIYKKIRDEIQAYSREGGYDLVLRVRDPEIGNFDQALRPRHKYLELNRRIESRGVLFHKSAHDFTQSIIDRLNVKYRRAKDEKKKARPTTESAAPEGKE